MKRINNASPWTIFNQPNDFEREIKNHLSLLMKYDVKVFMLVIKDVEYEQEFNDHTLKITMSSADKDGVFEDFEMRFYVNKRALSFHMNPLDMKDFIINYVEQTKVLLRTKKMFEVGFSGNSDSTVLHDLDIDSFKKENLLVGNTNRKFLLMSYNINNNSAKALLDTVSLKNKELSELESTFATKFIEGLVHKDTIDSGLNSIGFYQYLDKLGFKVGNLDFAKNLSVLMLKTTISNVPVTLIFHPTFYGFIKNDNWETFNYWFILDAKLGRTKINSMKKYTDYLSVLLVSSSGNSKELLPTIAEVYKVYVKALKNVK